jgi:hypothetical protein
MVGGVDKEKSNNHSDTLISGKGKTPAGVFDDYDGGDYHVSDADLKDKGDPAYYPGTVQALLDQCFEMYDSKGGVTSGIRSQLSALLGESNTVGVLGKDRGGGLRTIGQIDVGAYEK